MNSPAQAPTAFDRRVQKLQSQLSPSQAIVITNPHDVHYFSGFELLVPEEREAFLIVSSQSVTLQYAAFSPNNVPLTCYKKTGCNPSDLSLTLVELARRETAVSELLIDEQALFVHEYKALPDRFSLIPLDRQLIWDSRSVKDELEQALLRQAGQIAVQAYTEIVGESGEKLPLGMTERELAFGLEQKMRELGASGPAFPTIVAFGPSGALPHYQPNDQALTSNTPVLIDFGATYQRYRSDMTRSFWFGDQPSEEFLEVQTIIHESYQAALQVLTQQTWSDISSYPTAKNIDDAARNHIENQGYGAAFIHTTGHGLGLEIHEQPSLNWRNQTKIVPGMAITIEPGIYLEGKFGYRYENTLLVTETGPEILTESTA